MNYLLDTCVLSEFVQAAPLPTLQEWLEKQDEETLFLSVLTLAELEKGVAKMGASQKKDRLKKWIHHDLPVRFQGRVISIDEDIARKWGELCAVSEKAGRKLPVIDSLIAVSALTHDLTVVTRNVSDMKDTGVSLLNPWEE